MFLQRVQYVLKWPLLIFVVHVCRFWMGVYDYGCQMLSTETAATAFWPGLASQRQFDESELSLEMRHDVIVALVWQHRMTLYGRTVPKCLTKKY